MCELYVTCDVCMLNPVRSWLYVAESLKSLVISRTAGFIWARVKVQLSRQLSLYLCSYKLDGSVTIYIIVTN
jgi:hypothetical protein